MSEQLDTSVPPLATNDGQEEGEETGETTESNSPSSESRKRKTPADGHENEPTVVSFKRFRKEPLPDEAIHNWELPDEMVTYAQKYFERFVNERDMKDSVCKENPVPKNFLQKPRPDEHFQELLKEMHRKRDIDLDNSYEIIQKRMLQIRAHCPNCGFGWKKLMLKTLLRVWI